MIGSILALVGCTADGLTEGHHWGGEEFLLPNGVDWYHPSKALMMGGFMIGGLIGYG